uniref:G_PROTEIN_RECEP_F1_2 domain-containing protein n=1 Tax=Rhabditophanes sp. KR3021 TaxID=114890 RepID=A0AC35TNC0_9BILA
MDVCEDAKNTNGNTGIIIIWIFLIIQNLLCISGLFLVSYLIVKFNIFHVHLRILILSLHFSFWARSFGTTYRAIRFLTQAIFAVNKCSYLQEFAHCKIISQINGGPIGTILYIFLLICLERILSVLIFETYEKKSFKVFFFIPIVGIWYSPVSKFIYLLSDGDTLNSNKTMAYCNSLNSKVATPDSYFTLELPICLLTFVLSIAVYVYSKILLKKFKVVQLQNNRLTVKFQLIELINSSKTVAILSMLYCVDLSVNTYLVLTIGNTIYNNNRDFAFDKELSAYIIPVYILLYCAVILSFCEPISKALATIWLVEKKLEKFKKQKISPLGNGNDYFAVYKNSGW